MEVCLTSNEIALFWDKLGRKKGRKSRIQFLGMIYVYTTISLNFMIAVVRQHLDIKLAVLCPYQMKKPFSLFTLPIYEMVSCGQDQ